MTGKSHFRVGLTTGIALCLNANTICNAFPQIPLTQETKTLMVVGAAVGSLLPDIDNYSSTIALLFEPLPRLTNDVMLAVLRKDYYRHRYISHAIGWLMVCLVLSYYFNTSLIWLCIGCLTHAVVDMFNPHGVPLLFPPFIDVRIQLASIKSDSKTAEWLCNVVSFGILMAGIVARCGDFETLWDYIKQFILS